MAHKDYLRLIQTVQTFSVGIMYITVEIKNL